ncbi:MAG: hypothetical protein UY41_C0042G0003 [Candidatus Moranbacteria bacterium GW2011_GWE1_49_15]|nr:MAG: hypothetical protein UY41_C0042G0003 [Candidatus Moranbacteria bacterium GW2011_GWE1_49_15]HBP01254.1 hypothetical protein [Candidatus Moranbacteria bacterium]
MKKNKKISIFSILWTFAIFGSAFLPGTPDASAAYQLESTAFHAYSQRYIGTTYKPEGTAFYAYTSQEAGTVPVYRFYSKKTGDHFYTTSENEKIKLSESLNSSYAFEGTAFYALPDDSLQPSAVPVYRFYNSSNGDHFYTASENEKDKITNNLSTLYQYEGIAFYSLPDDSIESASPIYRFHNSSSGDHFYTADGNEATSLSNLSKKITFPIYRFYSPSNGDHFYTISETEKNKLVANPTFFKYEGEVFYAYPDSSVDPALSPVYRFYNSTTGDHLYTILENEKESLLNNAGSGYVYEGTAFYAYVEELSGTLPVYRFYDSSSGDHFYTISENEKNRLEIPLVGPEISVGLWSKTRRGSQDSPFRIRANKPYNIKNSNGDVVAQIPASTDTYVSYDDNDKLKVTGSVSKTVVGPFVTFDAADGNNLDMVFDVNTPVAGLDQYRGKFRVKFTKFDDNKNGTISDSERQIWAINLLPMEHYVWGMGEITGTGAIEYNKVMTTSFRTYGYYKLHHGTAYLNRGFIVNATPGNQLYYGYEWEVSHSRIKTAAESTRGKIVTHPQSAFHGDVAITPYSSWTDGRTRSFQERWGSTSYPWCQSVSDPYGKHATMNTTELEAAGNHMVGLSAHGALNLATDHDWDWEKILKYYYTGINITAIY